MRSRMSLTLVHWDFSGTWVLNTWKSLNKHLLNKWRELHWLCEVLLAKPSLSNFDILTFLNILCTYRLFPITRTLSAKVLFPDGWIVPPSPFCFIPPNWHLTTPTCLWLLHALGFCFTNQKRGFPMGKAYVLGQGIEKEEKVCERMILKWVSKIRSFIFL